MPKQSLITFLLISFAISGCTDPQPWSNAQRFEKTETSIVYDAPQTAAEDIAAAWSPSALVPISDNRIIYAAKGTRKLIELETDTGKQHILFDLTSTEEQFSSNAWASGLYWIKDWLIVATPQQKLVFCNRLTGQIVSIGITNNPDAILPADGITLENIDFALFGGIAPSPTGVYLALGEQIFHAEWDGHHPQTLSQAKLKHIAGSLETGDNANPYDALKTPLSLHAYTHFAHKDGWLFFWSGRRLKAVKDGVMLTITGHGFSSPTGELDTFYAYALPTDPPLIAHQGILYTPYWDDNPALLRIDVTNIDTSTHEVTGTLYDIYPQSGVLNTIAPWNDKIISADTAAGSFWQFKPESLPTDTIETTRIFGPESPETRFESIATDPHSPYEPNAILAPQAIATFKNDAYHLVYAPTLKRLSLLPAHFQKSAPVWEGYLSHLLTDGGKRAWFAASNTMYFFELSDNMNIQLSHVPQFFRSAPIMGVPCDRSRFRLTHPAQIETAGDDIWLFIPEAYRVLQYHAPKDQATFMHEGGWYKPSAENPSFVTGALQISTVEQWKAAQNMEIAVLKDDADEPYLAVINLKTKSKKIAGHLLYPNDGFVLAGGGSHPVANGLPLEQTDFDAIHAIAMTPQSSIIVATNGNLFETTSEGIWQIWQTCTLESLPHPPESLEIMGTPGKRIVWAKTGTQVYACAEAQTTTAGFAINTQWSQIPQNHIEPCTESSKLIMFENADRQICRLDTQIPSSDPKCLSVPDDFEVLDIACNDQNLYVSGYMISKDQNLIMHASLDTFQTLTHYLGMGSGLPDEEIISKITLGSRLGGMAVDGIPWLYLWMKDTCTLWKMPAFRQHDIDADTPVYRLVTDSLLCNAKAFAVTQTGQMAIATDQTLYEIDGTDFIPLGKLEHEVIDMIAMGHGFVLMTKDGLYLWEKGRITKRASNPLWNDGKAIHFAKPGTVWPRMTQSPGENAVLVPVFEGDRIVKIAL